MDQDNRKKILPFLLLSLLLHLFFLWLLPLQPHDEVATDVEVLDVTLLKKYRIADIQKPEQEERPEQADFVGLYDSRVEKEQVAPTPTRPGATTQSTERAKLIEQKPNVSEESLAARYAMRSREQVREAERSPESADRAGELPEDFYPDYKIGPHTYLNVLRFPDVEYFVRLKRVFKMTFSPVPALRGALLANQITRGQIEVVLGVVVDVGGRLAELFVINGSGLESYDQEALRTVRDSAPFAKPPAQILGDDGQLRMSWTFTVYL